MTVYTYSRVNPNDTAQPRSKSVTAIYMGLRV